MQSKLGLAAVSIVVLFHCHPGSAATPSSESAEGDAVEVGQVNIVVRDMERSLGFYRTLGLLIPNTLPEWQAHHRTAVTNGQPSIEFDSEAFAAMWNTGRSRAQGNVLIGLTLATREQVDEVCGKLRQAGHRIIQEPYDAFWGARYAVVEDPDGNAVGLTSRVDPGRVSAPPTPPE